ncbi:MAG: hypothetical protein RLZZ522_454 [Verrucomicrobiota bacterium]
METELLTDVKTQPGVAASKGDGLEHSVDGGGGCTLQEIRWRDFILILTPPET